MDPVPLSGKVKARMYRLIFVIACVLLQACVQEKVVNVEVINHTSRQLRNIVVEIYDIQYEVEKLNSGEHFTFSFLPKWETEYSISWRTDDGRQIDQKVGYISSGLNENDYLKINSSKVTFESK